MINIQEVRKVQREKIDEQYHATCSALEREIDDQKQLFAKTLTAQQSAEQEFPDVLQTIEERIRRAIKNGIGNTVQYTLDESAKDTFIVSMLIPALTLSGFICRLKVNSNKLEISW